MKLFIFDHCPFCMKAKMVAGIKKLPVEFVYLQNDDVNARIEKVGANMVPILEKNDGSYMPESLDIARYLDEHDHHPIIEKSTHEEEISEWLNAARPLFAKLTFSRWTQLDLPEFARPEAITWFTEKKEEFIGMSFEQALANSNEYINALNPLLVNANFITLPSEKGNQITWDDINFFPFIRNLTVVKGLDFPPHLKNYLEEISELTGVHLFFDVAV
ncbi:glutaredoxin 2 [Aliivibrio fischeri]|uniref:glutaredoxin 2 n=1 Tax=Aliivibrio fischeri TaxID=668 RepID=UPI0012D8CF2A|nr:glutaredoxin 2 [Aliivibrio fischeri]MUK91657.1 glutaredoxin 2 [Aliivibrio fischeri]